VRGKAAGILFLSGLAALAHQVLWTRRLVDLLGASSETFSIVVGAFFVGLAMGSAWAALKPAGPGRGWRRVAVAEGVVGLTALAPLLGVELLVEAGVGWLGWGVVEMGAGAGIDRAAGVRDGSGLSGGERGSGG
jgi:spermidine synthase